MFTTTEIEMRNIAMMNLDENFEFPKRLEKYKTRIEPGTKSIEEIYMWLTERFDLIELSKEQIYQDYRIRNDVFKQNCLSLTNNNDFKIRAFQIVKNEKSYAYFEDEDEEELILWVEDYSLTFDCSSNRLFRELMIEKGISQFDYEQNTPRLAEYIILYFNLHH